MLNDYIATIEWELPDKSRVTQRSEIRAVNAREAHYEAIASANNSTLPHGSRVVVDECKVELR